MQSERTSSFGHRGFLLCQDAQEQVPEGWVRLPCIAENAIRTVAQSMGLGKYIMSNKPSSTLVTVSACHHDFPPPPPPLCLMGLPSSPFEEAGKICDFFGQQNGSSLPFLLSHDAKIDMKIQLS